MGFGSSYEGGALEQRIAPLYKQCDPQRLARSLPGFGPVIAPIMVAETGTDLSRFPAPDRFASWTGLVGKASGSAGKQIEGLPITKAGRDIVKWALHMAANIARQHDPQLRDFYDRLPAKARSHNVAVTAVAHQLARRCWSVMTQQHPSEIRPPN